VHRKPKAASAALRQSGSTLLPSLHATCCMRRRRQTEAVCSAATSSMRMRPNTNRRQLITSGDHSTVDAHGLDTAGPICTIWICTVLICTISTSSHRTCCDSSPSRPARHAGVAQWGQGAPDAGVSRGHKRIGFRQRNLFAYEETPTPTMAAKAVRTNLILMRVIYFLQLLRLRSLLEGRHVASPPQCRTCSYRP
jgi:hypothetical protein